MLNLFKKKSSETKVIDKIWMAQVDKWKACAELTRTNPDNFFVAWFDETRQQLEDIFIKENLPIQNILSAREAGTHQLKNKPFVFIEHYPLRSKEQLLFTSLQPSDILIYSALDEPLFMHFGGEKIIQMMKQLGMKETESIENSMLSNAIRNAQEKIEKKVLADQTSRSQNDWLSKNFSS
jgi:hypothetical protein